MNYEKQYRLVRSFFVNLLSYLAVLLILITNSPVLANEPVSNEVLQKLQSLNKELVQAKEYLETIRQKAFEADPSFKYSIELEEEALKKDSDITQNRIEVMRYIQNEAQKHSDIDIKQLYWNLRGAVAESLKYQTTKDMMEDVQKKPLLLFLVKTYYSEKKDNDDDKIKEMTDDELIEVYSALLKSLEQPSLDKIQEIKNTGIFPDFVFDHAEDEARVSSLRSLADVYIQLNKPEELQLAEDKVSNLQAKMTQLYPEWHTSTIEARNITEAVADQALLEKKSTDTDKEMLVVNERAEISKTEAPNQIEISTASDADNETKGLSLMAISLFTILGIVGLFILFKLICKQH